MPKGDPMKKKRLCNEAQLDRLFEIYNRSNDWWGNEKPATFDDMLETLMIPFMMDGAVVLPMGNMFIAIERDGYAHT